MGMGAVAVRRNAVWPFLTRLGLVQLTLGVLLWIRILLQRALTPYPLDAEPRDALFIEFLAALLTAIGGAGLATRHRWGLRWSAAAAGALYVNSVFALRSSLRPTCSALRVPGGLTELSGLASTAYCAQSVVALLVATAMLWILLHEVRQVPGRPERLASAILAALLVLLAHGLLMKLHFDPGRC